MRVNVDGTRNVLAAARAARVPRVVHTSSVAAIGVRPDGLAADETYQSGPATLIGAYKRSKYLGEVEAHRAAAEAQGPAVVAGAEEDDLVDAATDGQGDLGVDHPEPRRSGRRPADRRGGEGSGDAAIEQALALHVALGGEWTRALLAGSLGREPARRDRRSCGARHLGPVRV